MIRRAPILCLAAILLLSFIGLSPIALVGASDAAGGPNADGDTARQISFVLVFLGAASHAALSGGWRRMFAVPPGLSLVLAWCWVTLLWSVAPAVALRRLTLTTIVILSVTYCVNTRSPQTILRVLLGTFAAILLADWLAVELLPWAVQQPTEVEAELAGNWRGMHIHKNEAGAFCALACILFAHQSYRSRSFVSGPMLLAASAVFLVMTQSKTSGGFVGVAMIVGSLSCLSYAHARTRDLALVCLAFVLAVVVGSGVIPYDAVAATFDDPASFTGRSQIWPVLISFAGDHLLFGSGYGSFWSIGPTSPIYDYASGWVTNVFEAHDGYLDLQVQIGAIGLALAVVGLVLLPLRTLFFRPINSHVSRWLVCSTLSFAFLHDLFESSLLDRANPTWVVMLVMYALLAKPAPQDQPVTTRWLSLSADLG